MREEKSAGFIVFRIDPADGRRLYLLLDYGRFWDYPKGHVEAGEDDRAAALRELAEEAGIIGPRVVDGFCETVTYHFRARGNLIRKSVVFFLAEVTSPEVIISHEHAGFAWLDYDAALTRVTYPSANAALQKARAFLSDNS